ncbi:MAG: hypothetical protein K9K66_13260 [Desulfarculaceae bacterium]|nr:hypothetical protein [Desulfarculaceae bacterium]MCF8073933.1 hypothetical protein [Desulfarculaceae bacterium]MCF8102619.1 hypothetical protein [Desulfarculaceae bacterium]MCF8117612.1 hypothetical protein [Desulfarculaceae bacterium]
MPETPPAPPEPEGILINEAQFLLAQKRTQLAAVRTGLAVLAVPMGIISLLIVTSRLYHFWDNLGYLVPLFVVCLGLIGLGVSLIIRSLTHLRRTEHSLRKVTSTSPHLWNLED